MFCTKCGNQMPDGSAFCTKCGAPAGGAAPTAVPAPGAPAARKRRTGLAIGIAAAAVAVLAVVGFAVWSAFFAPYEINEDRFPDAGLRAAVAAQLDPDGDGKVTRDEARAVESLSIEGASEVAGLGIFPNLRELRLAGDALASADVADLPALEVLSAEGCPSLSEVTLGDKPALRELALPGTQVTALDLAGAPALESLNAEGAPLPELSLEACGALASANLRGTGLSALDLAANGSLTELLVDDAVALENLDATPLREQWVPVSCSFFRPAVNGIPAKSEAGEAALDELGRVTRIDTTLYDEPVAYTYTYDEAGRVAAMASEGAGLGAQWQMEYDDAGRFVRASSDMGDEQSIVYDDAGRPQSCRFAEGQGGARTVSFTYDEAGRLASWTEGSDGMAVQWTVGYDGNGAVQSLANRTSDPDHDATYEVARDAEGAVQSVTSRSPYLGEVTVALTREGGLLSNATCTAGADAMYKTLQGSPNVTSTTFAYDGDRLVKWEPVYAQDAMFAHVPNPGTGGPGANEITWGRILVPSDSAPAASFVAAANPLNPKIDPSFWNPLSAFGGWGTDVSAIIFGGVPTAFEGDSAAKA